MKEKEKDIETLLSEADKAGNINKVIQLAVQNFKQMEAKPERSRQIVKYMDLCPAELSRKTLRLLETFTQGEYSEYAACCGMDKKIEKVKKIFADIHLSPQNKECEIGSALFPSVASEGAINKVKFFHNQTTLSAHRSLPPNEFNWLKNTGLALFSFLEVKTGRCLPWDPFSFSFGIFDTFDREDNRIEGDSLCKESNYAK